MQSRMMRKPLLYGLAIIALGLMLLWWILQQRRPAEDVVLTMDCGAIGRDYQLCLDLLEVFMQETGYRVVPRRTPADASLRLSVFRELALTRSEGMDVYMIDVIWPGILADALIDLRPHFNNDDLADFFPSMLANNSVNNRLVAIPYFTDAGMLYYRQDLLEKYGYSAPPRTWQELEIMAQVIQQGERSEGRENFWGFVWQGRQNEGLTCNALEWMVAEGAGSIVEADGSISIDNPDTLRAFNQARRWISSISPPNTPDLDEEASRLIWQAGNAVFMRNWPYAYSLANEDSSPVQGRFGIAPLPAGSARSAATLGGWQLGVSRHSRFPEAAVELVRFMTSPASQRYRAIAGSYNPTLRSLYEDPDVLEANPFFADMPNILENAVARPSTVTAERYEEVSTIFHTEINRMLRGIVEPPVALANIAQNLTLLKGEGW